jgi:hypothetical protein
LKRLKNIELTAQDAHADSVNVAQLILMYLMVKMFHSRVVRKMIASRASLLASRQAWCEPAFAASLQIA